MHPRKIWQQEKQQHLEQQHKWQQKQQELKQLQQQQSGKQQGVRPRLSNVERPFAPRDQERAHAHS